MILNATELGKIITKKIFLKVYFNEVPDSLEECRFVDSVKKQKSTEIRSTQKSEGTDTI